MGAPGAPVVDEWFGHQEQCMSPLYTLFVATLLAGLPAAQAASSPRDSQVDIDIVGANGRTFSIYPVRSESSDVLRAYLEARDQATYRIRVRNRSNQRVGLVIAVDGRNIISGDRSELARNERMYILDAWESEQYEGWRTGSERVNEFYFTQWRDSYAEAFGDRSARGVIAVAVYRERIPVATMSPEPYRSRPRYEVPDDTDRASAPAEEAESSARQQSPSRADSVAGAANAPAPGVMKEHRKSSTPGTGFGNEVYSPVRVVEFEPEYSAAMRHFIKYEWRDALCRKQVVDCKPREKNRFWDDDGYAPYPPRRG